MSSMHLGGRRGRGTVTVCEGHLIVAYVVARRRVLSTRSSSSVVPASAYLTGELRRHADLPRTADGKFDVLAAHSAEVPNLESGRQVVFEGVWRRLRGMVAAADSRETLALTARHSGWRGGDLDRLRCARRRLPALSEAGADGFKRCDATH